jgi:hypothetical protein
MKTKQYYPHILTSCTLTLLENRVEVIEKSPWTYVRREIPYNKISSNYINIIKSEVVLLDIFWLGIASLICFFVFGAISPHIHRLATIFYIPINIITISSFVLRFFFKRTYKTFKNLEDENLFSVEIKSGLKHEIESENFVKELLYKIDSCYKETTKGTEGSGAL